MRTTYEEKRIPLQIRRLMLFNEICHKAKKYPDEVVHLAGYSKIAFNIVYSKKDKKYSQRNINPLQYIIWHTQKITDN